MIAREDPINHWWLQSCRAVFFHGDGHMLKVLYEKSQHWKLLSLRIPLPLKHLIVDECPHTPSWVFEVPASFPALFSQPLFGVRWPLQFWSDFPELRLTGGPVQYGQHWSHSVWRERRSVSFCWACHCLVMQRHADVSAHLTHLPTG